MSMHDSRDRYTRDPYDVDDESRSPDSDYPPPEGFSPEGDFRGFPRPESGRPRIAPTSRPASGGRNLWLTLASIAVLTGAAITGIVLLGPAAGGSPNTETTAKPEPRPTDAYPGAADDDMVRAQIDDCITFADENDDESWRVVDCDAKEALGKVYGFALGTTDVDKCAEGPKGSKTRYHYALNYRESKRDDYVVCAASIED